MHATADYRTKIGSRIGRLMDLPIFYPVHIRIENLWSVLKWKMYGFGCYFATKEDLGQIYVPNAEAIIAEFTI